jgi:SAM-dependent methyltransferase
MAGTSPTKTSATYILSAGEPEVERLRLLNDSYGPASEAFLRRAGLRPGMRIVEIGCGTGNMTCWLAKQVGPTGAVVGVDRSPDQLEMARRLAEERGLPNVTFHAADVRSLGLPTESFDLAYCRLLLMHLKRPLDVVRGMRDLVRLGGVVAAEEMDLGVWLCDPPSPLMARFFDFNLAIAARRGTHFNLGRSLHNVFREAGLHHPEVSSSFPLLLRGDAKRLLGLTFVEFAPALVSEGLATQAETDAVTAECFRVAEDDTILLGLPFVGQVWATR